MKSKISIIAIVLICLCLSIIEAAKIKQNLIRCASEGKKCQFSGYKIVKFGTDGKFNYKAFTNGVDCNIFKFGDPFLFRSKFCEIPTSDYYWIYCSDENGRCNFSGSRYVRYGKNGKFEFRQGTNGVDCNNSVFGDPIKIGKQCHYAEDFDPKSFSWGKCGQQGGVCNFKGTQIVKYGKHEAWSYMQATDKINCNDEEFGDSNYGEAKECLYNLTNEEKCPEGLFLNDKQCVSICPAGKFVSSDNKLCLGQCAQTDVFITKTHMCLETCPNGYFLRGQECFQCEPGTITSLDGFSCVTKCPNDHFLILAANRCFAYCPTYYKVVLERNECLLNCSEGKLLTTADNSHCVSKCPAGQYKLGNNCLYDCPFGFLISGESCVTTCPDNTFKSSDNRACVTACPAGQFTSKADKQCYTRCPLSTFTNGSECVSACPSGTLRSFDNSECVAKCPDGHFTYTAGGACYSPCLPNLFVNGAECVDACPTGTVLDGDRRNCLSACPKDQFLVASYSTCYYSCPFNYNTTGNTCTLIPKPNSSV